MIFFRRCFKFPQPHQVQFRGKLFMQARPDINSWSTISVSCSLNVVCINLIHSEVAQIIQHGRGQIKPLYPGGTCSIQISYNAIYVYLVSCHLVSRQGELLNVLIYNVTLFKISIKQSMSDIIKLRSFFMNRKSFLTALRNCLLDCVVGLEVMFSQTKNKRLPSLC